MNAASNAETARGLLKRASRIGKKIHGEIGCSMPGTHDRLAESRYFLGQMLVTYHSPDEFRWNVHAFLQALRSFEYVAKMESQGASEFKEFRRGLGELTDQAKWKRLDKMRDSIVHKEPLLTNASMSIGMYRNGRLKLAFHLEMPTYLPSWIAIAKSRNDRSFVPPHREWIGEEIGLERTWRLPDFEEELTTVCFAILADCNSVLQLSPGHEEMGNICQGLDIQSPRLMLEHELFPEIIGAWDGQPPSMMRAITDTAITVLPEQESQTLHEIRTGTKVSAWINNVSTWHRTHTSLLIYGINDVETRENTAGFFKRAAFDKPIPGEWPASPEDGE